MTKFILTTSILSLFALPAYAANDGVFSKLERGIKAEANSQLQGAANGALKEIAPSAVQRAVKPAANDLVKKSVEASSSVLSKGNIGAASSKGAVNEMPAPDAAVSATNSHEGLENTSPTPISTTTPALATDKESLFIIPDYDGTPLAGRLCNAWTGPGCIQEDRSWIKRRYPDQKTASAVHLGVRAVWDEGNAWAKVYSPSTGKVDFNGAAEQDIENLVRSVKRTNELIGKGLIHRDSITFRECFKRGLPTNIKAVRTSKADVCG